MNATILALLLCGAVPHEEAIVDEVDLLEVNHMFDEQGKKIYSQIIFYEWNSTKSRHDVVGWRILPTRTNAATKKTSLAAMDLPIYNERDGVYVCTWNDAKYGAGLRRVKSHNFRETYTQYDPEKEARTQLPADQRRGLTRPVTQVSAGMNISLSHVRVR